MQVFILALKTHFLFLVELALWCCIVLATLVVRRRFSSVHSNWMRLARRPLAALLVPPLVAVAVRLALLPLFPVPYPIIRDEFAYLLAADTYASGRLTNPTHSSYEHFESRHVLHKPTYMAKYPPGQGLILAVGQALGHPWVGVLLSMITMCALLGWASRPYLTGPWTLALVSLASLRYIPLSYWANSYWGGALAAIGGCLVIGALARLTRTPSLRYGALLGSGLGVLACSRPSEGLAFGVVACSLWAISQLARNRWRVVALRYLSSVAAAAVCVGFILAIFAYSNKAVTGNPFVMPYQAFNAQYEAAPIFVWQKPRTLEFDNARLVTAAKADLAFATQSSASSAFRWGIIARGIAYFFWPPILLLPLLLSVPTLLRQAQTRNLLVLIALSLLWTSLGLHFYAHYIAALLGPAMICGVQSLRVLRVSIRRWSRALGSPARAPRFATLVLGSHLCLLITAGIGATLALTARQWVLPNRGLGWCCPETSPGRKVIESQLLNFEGRHLVFVRYPNNELPYLEWVYNSANIDTSRIIWAHSLGHVKDAHLRHRYQNRHAWTADLTNYPAVSLDPFPKVVSGPTLRTPTPRMTSN